MKIQIKCTGTAFLPLDKIKDFQGELKRRSVQQFTQIKTSIEKYGFSFPFFIWKQGKNNWCLDGHGRLGALTQMRSEGWDIPELPVVFVQAKDQNEARQKLLRMNSSFGTMDIAGFQEFSAGFQVDWEELNLPGIKEDVIAATFSMDDFFAEKEAPASSSESVYVCIHCGKENVIK